MPVATPTRMTPGLALRQVTTTIAGGLTSLFTVGGTVGADAPGTSTGALSFIGIPAGGLATNLSATNGGAITLFLNNGVIEGRDTTNQVVLTIAIVGAPGSVQIQTTLFEALNHGADGNLFDSEQVMSLLNGTVQLQYSVTRTDSDGDAITRTATIDLITTGGSVFSFDDDGPTLTVAANAGAAALLATELDETVGADRYNTALAEGEDAGGNANTDDAGPGLAQVTTAVAGGLASLFTVTGNVGSDIAGSTTGTLSFIGIPPVGLATTLSATNGGADHAVHERAVIEGRDTQNQVVLTIAIVGGRARADADDAVRGAEPRRRRQPVR